VLHPFFSDGPFDVTREWNYEQLVHSKR